MIYKPYNVYPHNTAIDASLKNTFSFIFSGDKLSYIDWHFYDMSSGDLYKKFYVPYDVSNTYNDFENRTLYTADTFVNGHSYKYRINLYQHLHDIFVMEGTVRNITEIGLTDTQIPITYGITEIENPIKYVINDIETIIGSCYIEIDNGTIRERRMIINYNPNLKYGTDDGYGNYDYRTYVTISAPFSIKPTEGTKYKIFKNYITTPEYYFECTQTPVIVPDVKLSTRSGIIECNANYFQANGVSISNYQYSLYKKYENHVILETDVAENENGNEINIYLQDQQGERRIDEGNYITISYTDTENNYDISETRIVNSYNLSANYITVKQGFSFVPTAGMKVKIFSGTMQLVSQSEKIYNQTLKYKFDDILRNVDFKIVLKVQTQNGMIVENEYNGIFYSVDTSKDNPMTFKCYTDNQNNDIRIEHSSVVLIEREDIVTHEIQRVHFNYHPKHDYLAASNKQYIYHLIDMVQQDDEWVYGSSYTSTIQSPVWCDWALYGLMEHNDYNALNKQTYSVTDLWKMNINANEDAITQNINRNIHVGLTAFPKIITNNNNYRSGSFSCDISELNSVSKHFEDTIYKVEAWRKFITSHELFLLKNPKGDVMIVSITDNPTTQYNYKTKLMQTTINISYTECMDISDIAIVN